MSFIYHRVPEDLQGNTLYPLNQLKNTHPEIYQAQRNKYLGREQVMEKQIPLLNCLWNDVLHFAPIHPQLIKRALVEKGHSVLESTYYKIGVSELDFSKTVVYLYKNMKQFQTEDNFIMFDQERYTELDKVPKKTVSYYEEMKRIDKKPLLFHGIPHILYKGSLPISEKQVIVV